MYTLTVISLSKVAPPLFCDSIQMDTNDIEIMKFHTSIVVEGDNHDTIKIGGFFFFAKIDSFFMIFLKQGNND